MLLSLEPIVHVWWTSVSAIVSYPAHRVTERQSNSAHRTTPPSRSNCTVVHCLLLSSIFYLLLHSFTNINCALSFDIFNSFRLFL